MMINKEKIRLNKYCKEVKRIVKLGKMLNTKQKERLDAYANRVLAYCRNHTIIIYKYERVKDKELIPNVEQTIIYKQIFDEINKLAIRIRDDNVLTERTKKELGKVLKSLVGHIRGKQNRGNKYAERKYSNLVT